MNKSPIGDLKEKGIVILPYPADLRLAVEKAVESWKWFCELPIEIKMTLPHSNGGAGFGYEPGREGGDNKENFDFTVSAREFLIKEASKWGEPAIVRFLNDLLDIVNLIKPLAVGFANDCEKEFGSLFW